MRKITPADDNLHTPTSDDKYWTETAWFAFAIPERKLTAFVYPVFRANQNICAAGVFIWDDTGEGEHEILYSHNYWHLPMPEDLTKMRLETGLSYDVIEPLKKYRVRYETDSVSFDVIYEGLMEPILTKADDHLDQPCRVTGTLNLRGEKLNIDCYEIRDKSWHVRSDAPLELPPEIAQGSYSYAISKDFAFLAKTKGADKDNLEIDRGLLWKDGVVSHLVSGRRKVIREPGRPPSKVFLEATDEMGRSFTAEGNTVNHFAHRSTPSIWAWISGTNWEVDGETVWGEDQEWTAGANA